jgi:hypothetical protein
LEDSAAAEGSGKWINFRLRQRAKAEFVPAIPGFWDAGPHAPFLIEDTWNEFVLSNGGCSVAHELFKSLNFDNADYIIHSLGFIAELKEVVTGFGRAQAFQDGYKARNVLSRKTRPGDLYYSGATVSTHVGL